MQKLFNDELDKIQKQQFIKLLCVDNGIRDVQQHCIGTLTQWKMRLCFNPSRLNQVLIRPVQRVPTTSDIFPKLTHVNYHKIIDASSGYHSLKLNEKSSYLTTFPCQFGRYRYARLPFSSGAGGNIRIA